MSAWQPIAIAPKDGRRIILGKWRHGHWITEVGKYNVHPLPGMRPYEAFEVRAANFSPTHWMPLPEPPPADLPAGNSAPADGPGGSAQQIAGNVTDED